MYKTFVLENYTYWWYAGSWFERLYYVYPGSLSCTHLSVVVGKKYQLTSHDADKSLETTIFHTSSEFLSHQHMIGNQAMNEATSNFNVYIL